MNEQQLIDRLDARAADVPVGAPPVDAMRAAVRRRRSRASVLVAAAAVVAIAVGMSAWQIDRDSKSDVQVGVGPVPEVDVPPAGHRYVGIGTAVVAVPEEWGINKTTCGTPVKDTVLIDQGVICLMLVPRPADVDSVRVEPYYEGADFSTWVERDLIDGEPALWSPVTTAGGVTSGSVYVPSQKATFVAESSSADAQIVVNDLLTSIVLLQDHITVPGFQGLAYASRPNVDIYTDLLQQLGLSVEVVERKSQVAEGTVLATDPAVGSVVAPGDTVRVTVAR